MAKRRSATSRWMGYLLLGFLLPATHPLQADWLLTRDGKAVETRGAWKVEGKLVKFTSKAGTLSSIRLDEVDLEASRTETARRSAAPEPPPKPAAGPAKKSVRVIQDADVRHADPAANAVSGQPGPILLYSTSWCGYCRKARALLTELGVPFEEKDIEKSAAANTEYLGKNNGRSGVPLIDIDGKILRGFSEGAIRRLVAERRKPPVPKSETARAPG